MQRKAMHSFFARHSVDKEAAAHEWDSDTDPSAVFIAWLLWGGDAGKAWARWQGGQDGQSKGRLTGEAGTRYRMSMVEMGRGVSAAAPASRQHDPGQSGRAVLPPRG